MHKELRKELELKAKEFKHQPDDVKKRGRELYKVAIKALARCDYLQAQLDAYKAPKLYDKTETNRIPERTYLSLPELITEVLKNGPDSDEVERFLRRRKLTLDEAKEIVEKARQVK